MNKLKIFLSVFFTLVISISVAFAVTMSVDELKYLMDGQNQSASDLEVYGAASGPDIYQDTRYHAKVVDGGKYTNASTTLTTNITLTAKQVCESNVITVNSGAVAGTQSAAGLTVTLPATSTLFADCLREEGAHLSFLFANLSPTAASTTVITAGTGHDLLECDDGNDCNVVIGGGDRAIIEIWRMPTAFESNLDVVTTVTEYSVAD